MILLCNGTLYNVRLFLSSQPLKIDAPVPLMLCPDSLIQGSMFAWGAENWKINSDKQKDLQSNALPLS